MRISPFPHNWVRATLSNDLFEPFCLVAVVSSKGSVPRTTGTAMLVYKNQIMGSVGGGELEYQAIETAKSGLLQSGFKRLIRSFALGPSLGQCCGGAVNLMFEWYGHDNRSVLAALNSEITAFTEHDIVGQRIPKLCLKLSQAKKNLCINLQLNPPHIDVFLYGAGHVGRAVAEIVRHLCCQLYWVDTQENRFKGQPGQRNAMLALVLTSELSWEKLTIIFVKNLHLHLPKMVELVVPMTFINGCISRSST